MTSDLSNEITSLKLDGETTPSTTRRFYRTSHHQRHHLHSKRAATLDPETNEEKLRIVVLGATKVGELRLNKILNKILSSIIQVKHVYVNNFYKKNSLLITKKPSMKCIVLNFHLSIVELFSKF